MKGRIFFKLMAAFLLVIVAATLTLDLAMQRRGEAPLLEALGLALLLALLLAAFVAYSAARRLRSIMHFAERLSAGDLSAQVAETGSDEIGQVAAALDKAARTLEQRVSALAESRSQLQTLLDNIEEPVFAVSPDGKLRWANGPLARLLPAGARLRAPLVETARDPDLLRAVGDCLRERETCRVRANSVSPGKSFEVAATPLPDGGAVIVLHDVSEMERLEAMRRDFIANVSHELRTPLTSIQGYAETLLASNGGRDRDFLEIIRKNAARMSRLTEDLLTLARVESGEAKFDPEPASAGELLRDALAAGRELAHGRDIELAIERENSQLVLADRDAIQQVFSNLIENAVKYAPRGTRILLGARALGASVEFYVRDFGPGIPSEHLPRLFERFYRVDKARSREAGGTGLGLAIVKHIVLNHGGTARAESELGHGSTFYFTLPLAPVAALRT